MAKNSLSFAYSVPIQSNAKVDGDFVIEGTAITETVTSNGHKFTESTLRESANTLVGVPLLKDHVNTVDSIVGRVKEASFSEEKRSIPFRAIVKDEGAKEKIRLNLINSVSVGAHVDPQDIEELEDGTIVPRNITFKELSLVAVPADSAATFGVALNNAYKTFNSDHIENAERGQDNQMTTEETKTSNIEESQEPKTGENEVSAIEQKIKEVTLKLKKKELALMEKKLAEADADEEKAEEEAKAEPETKDESEDKSEEVVEDSDEEAAVEEGNKNYTITQGHNSFSYERKSYVY